MTTPTFPAPPDYTQWSKDQLSATQPVYQAVLDQAANHPPGPRFRLLPRLDTAMFANWLSALNSELAKRP